MLRFCWVMTLKWLSDIARFRFGLGLRLWRAMTDYEIIMLLINKKTGSSCCFFFLLVNVNTLQQTEDCLTILLPVAPNMELTSTFTSFHQVFYNKFDLGMNARGFVLNYASIWAAWTSSLQERDKIKGKGIKWGRRWKGKEAGGVRAKRMREEDKAGNDKRESRSQGRFSLREWDEREGGRNQHESRVKSQKVSFRPDPVLFSWRRTGNRTVWNGWDVIPSGSDCLSDTRIIVIPHWYRPENWGWRGDCGGETGRLIKRYRRPQVLGEKWAGLSFKTRQKVFIVPFKSEALASSPHWGLHRTLCFIWFHWRSVVPGWDLKSGGSMVWFEWDPPAEQWRPFHDLEGPFPSVCRPRTTVNALLVMHSGALEFSSVNRKLYSPVKCLLFSVTLVFCSISKTRGHTTVSWVVNGKGVAV